MTVNCSLLLNVRQVSRLVDSRLMIIFCENIQDFHHDPSVVNYRPEHLAIAGLFLALQCQGVSVPGEDDGLAWFTVRSVAF